MSTKVREWNKDIRQQYQTNVQKKSLGNDEVNNEKLINLLKKGNLG